MRFPLPPFWLFLSGKTDQRINHLWAWAFISPHRLHFVVLLCTYSKASFHTSWHYPSLSAPIWHLPVVNPQQQCGIFFYKNIFALYLHYASAELISTLRGSFPCRKTSLNPTECPTKKKGRAVWWSYLHFLDPIHRTKSFRKNIGLLLITVWESIWNGSLGGSGWGIPAIVQCARVLRTIGAAIAIMWWA